MNDHKGVALLRDALIWELEHEARHSDEFAAIRAAQDGKTEPLADLLETNGLETPEARDIAARIVRGEKKKGRPASTAQFEKELRAFGTVYAMMCAKGVGLEKAVDLCVEADPDLSENESTFRTHARRGQKKFKSLLNGYVQRHLQRTQK
ncbi:MULTISPECIES: hypothetical protein [unclassified Aliiroseovarius]|jgi:hypothetical protein|uniref:hypothetical protein n=1 Tax=unclassified Aliiroseovarius TaxID=2623558 RepID=UPI00156997BD|nr:MULTISPECIES: hypothetical protein [unclassified Aliiroseovarius]NRP29373.1 hypothetical protein [Aliiroseovarius sp. xm-m-314]NRP44112.1 hypothetical protein [Aliiroseovarius sp. xm-m-378]NRP64983.1 hypothetical protein [Aliiroseovarius sp. xm-v-225]NRP79015.1 hypothetical protein [Aliiroseovarius sp. xm-v-209]NRP91851.1 hypothetical protein [Aliiroseovarius sp. xm-a-134]